MEILDLDAITDKSFNTLGFYPELKIDLTKIFEPITDISKTWVQGFIQVLNKPLQEMGRSLIESLAQEYSILSTNLSRGISLVKSVDHNDIYDDIESMERIYDDFINMDLDIVHEQNSKNYEYYPETNTFLMHLYLPVAITFETSKKRDSMTILFKILLEKLEKEGVYTDGYDVVFVLRKEILQRAINNGEPDANEEWLKHTRSNLVKYKIPAKLERSIILSEYNRKKKGYYFKVKRYSRSLN